MLPFVCLLAAEDAKKLWSKTKGYFQQRHRIVDPSGSGAPDFDKLGQYGRQLSFLLPVVMRGK